MTWLLLMTLACSGGAPSPSEAPVPAEDPSQSGSEAAPAPAPALPAPTEPRYAATHLLVAHQDAVGAAEGVERSREEARALAEELRARAVAGEPLEDLARAHSDGPSGPRGGRLGVYLTGTMMPAFEAAVASVEPGALAPLVETPYGWHVARRDPIQQIEASHVLVSFAGAWRSAETRSRDEARARAQEVLAALRAGTPFEEVAARFSDDATADHGGSLGVVAPGQMIPDFEAAAFALAPGETSEVVETPYGFHVIRRTR